MMIYAMRARDIVTRACRGGMLKSVMPLNIIQYQQQYINR